MRYLIIFILALVLQGQELLSTKVLNEIQILKDELYSKTKIKADLLISDKENLQELLNKIKDEKDYAFIIISLKDKRLLVKSDLKLNFSSVSDFYYLKYGFLPTQGTILPLLTQPKGSDTLNAAIINGFSQLCDIIADFKGVKLENSFGDANDNFIGILRFAFYFILLLVLIKFILKKIKKGNK